MAVLVPRETPKTWKLQEVLVTEPSIIERAIGAAAIGNITECYDFSIYAYFEPNNPQGVLRGPRRDRAARSRRSGCSRWRS